MDKVAVLFTMKSCPFCVDLKEMLVKEGIDFVDRDINEYEEEYNLFIKLITKLEQYLKQEELTFDQYVIYVCPRQRF